LPESDRDRGRLPAGKPPFFVLPQQETDEFTQQQKTPANSPGFKRVFDHQKSKPPGSRLRLDI
jgi:hypothetical protein